MVVRGKPRAIGRIGEEHAVEHLTGLGWQVLDRNWRCNEGELDIIAHDPHAGALVFIEVKCRSGLGFGDPLEAVTWRKRKNYDSSVGCGLPSTESERTSCASTP